MNRLSTIFNRISTSIVIFVQIATISVAQVPRAAFAEEAPAPASCPTVNGTAAPTGASAHTFRFRPADGPAPNCVWENAYYYWDPATKVYTPKFETRECSETSGICENITWDYVSSSGTYVERRTVVYVPPAPASTQQNEPTPLSHSGGGGNSSAQSSASIVSGNGTDSESTVAQNNTISTNANLTNKVNVLSTLNSNANSGNAAALFNTTVGDVGTGNATGVANVLNMIQSSWDPSQGNLNVFSADLFANYYGDLLFDPSIVLGNGTTSNNTITRDAKNDLTLNVANDANIQNDINLNATSGNATANGNTSVGNVTTGDANVVANVINMINSMITAGNSFIGSINLHGDLNGDILLPRSIMEILLGNGSGARNTITDNTSATTTAHRFTNSTIANNTDLQAVSGNAQANSNTSVGDVSTGNASTKVNEMNLVGQNVQNRGGLLVFVNVLGSWVGMLFNAPVNASIAAGNGTNSDNLINSNTDTNADISIENNYGITNNLNLRAQTGNATANANTTVGDVSTGNATASANILNMIDSTMNFTDWFGVLFINVFGKWQGSFGVNTENGNRPEGGMGGGAPTTSGNSGSPSSNVGSSLGNTIRTLGASTSFRAATSRALGGSDQAQTDLQSASNTQASGNPVSDSSENDTQPPTITANLARNNSAVWWITGIAGLTSLLLLGGERLLLLIRKR